MDIVAVFGRHFDVRVPVLLGVFLYLLLGYFSLCDVRFVSHQKDQRILPSRLPHEIQPFVHPLQRRSNTYIYHYQASIRIAHV